MKTVQYDVIIIGGGASGIMAGIAAAREGALVLILEHMDRIGRKILSTGNGKCNLSNADQSVRNYRGENPRFAYHLLEKFGLRETLSFFNSIGIYVKDKKGYLYPNSEQAASVLDVLRMEAEYRNVEIECNVNVKKIEKERSCFQVFTENKRYRAFKVILAAGGMAAPVTGSDGSGYDLAKKFGHKIITPVPSLVQLKGQGDYFKSLSGVRVQANISLYINRKKMYEEYGELQFVNYGISGIPVFQLSRYAARGVKEGKNVIVTIDFLPELDDKKLVTLIQERIRLCPYKSNEELFIGMFNKKLNIVLLKKTGIDLKEKVTSISMSQITSLVKIIKEFEIKITGSNSFENAQVCAGGVDTVEIDNDTLESKIVNGLYFTGEIMDVDGACGGYNLQWAWTSGHIAGSIAAKMALTEKEENR